MKEVVDEPFATEETAEVPIPDQHLSEEQLAQEIPAEAAFADLDRAKEEDNQQDQPDHLLKRRDN